MTPDKVREVISLYRAYFVRCGIEEIDYPHDDIVGSSSAIFSHHHGVFNEMIIMTHRTYFVGRGVEKINYPHDKVVNSPPDTLGHCHGMLDKMVEFIQEGRMDKTFRWFGSIQGCIRASEAYTKEIVNSQAETLGHCHGMLDEIEEFILAGRIEKTFIWLGFIQGCLWALGIYTLAELRKHNRRD